MTDLLPQVKGRKDQPLLSSDNGVGRADSEVFSNVEVNNMDSSMKSFYENVAQIQTKLGHIDRLNNKIKADYEQTKTTTKEEILQRQREKLNQDLDELSGMAKSINQSINKLSKENQVALQQAGQGVGTANERTRSSITAGLAKSLKARVSAFNSLRENISRDQQDVVGRRVQAVTGEKPSLERIQSIIDNGEDDQFYQKAIQTSGRVRAMDTLAEIRQRNDAVKELERTLLELQEVFRDMAILVEEQGQMVDDIQANVYRAKSHVDGGTRALIKAKASVRNTRKWIIIGTVVAIVIIAVVVGAVVGYICTHSDCQNVRSAPQAVQAVQGHPVTPANPSSGAFSQGQPSSSSPSPSPSPSPQQNGQQQQSPSPSPQQNGQQSPGSNPGQPTQAQVNQQQQEQQQTQANNQRLNQQQTQQNQGPNQGKRLLLMQPDDSLLYEEPPQDIPTKFCVSGAIISLVDTLENYQKILFSKIFSNNGGHKLSPKLLL